ncbi:hypothetical protein GQ55_5G218000 [Panicum hallii var. hallii]|uniref:Uncharacterized protein n=1 Tax=Panicum hallii var. hallii TaxID=1504633 RepID=A0A2T7DIV5_9POAL|nr:hypothetical protein GQ55_5G218000 [Panicum hallii var. hallii]
MILLEEEHFKRHIKVHPKDAELLNRLLENYKQMQIIFGNGQATGKSAMGSSEPLGSPSDFGESSLKPDSDCMKVDDVAKLFREAPKDEDGAAGGGNGSGGGNKRRRCMLSEEDIIVMTGMTGAVKEVAAALRETKVENSHPELYGAVMFMPGFSGEALLAAYSHLLDNKAHGTTFVKMTNSYRVLWLRTYLAMHYYM